VVPATVNSSLTGQELDGRYEVLELLGTGGVGNVYRARLLTLDRVVAIKVLHDSTVQNAELVARFEREAKAMSRLYHPHCAAVIDFGMCESRPYLVLEYLPGHTVNKLLEQGPFPAPRAVRICLQLLDALAYFHRHHVIHRDLKSENVMLVESGARKDFVKVLDFGMAKILEGDGADSQLSKIGLIPGTASTMSPEQIQQLSPDSRIDIYAAGILLYEMIVGHRPFRGPDAATVVRQQVTTPPIPPRRILGEAALSAELERIILKALEKSRDNRFATADLMAEELRLTPEGRPTDSRAVVDLPELVAEPARSQRPPSPPELGTPPAAPGRGPPPTPGTSAPRPLALPGPGARSTRRGAQRPGPRRWPLLAGAVLSLGAVMAAWTWSKRRPAEAPPPEHVAAGTAATPVVAPPPAPVLVPWLAHRDLAITYMARGQRDDAFREVKAAFGDNAAAASADAALMDASVAALSADRVAFVVGAFRSNLRLAGALSDATARGATTELRHAAYDGLDALGQRSRADVIAMRILDVEQATSCPPMRTAWKALQGAKDPRVRQLLRDLLARGRKDRHVRCLGRALRH
jgi:serine/threonine protein kinase